MPRETAVERNLRLARENAEREALTEAYRASIPARMMVASALAQEVGISTNISLTPIGPSVRFYDDSREGYFDATICYTTEEWELEHLEEHLREKKAEKDARAARLNLAKKTFDSLSEDQRVALKENIHYLR
jgi:hypothetical protein